MKKTLPNTKNFEMIRGMETIYMKYLGRRDGRIGFPVENSLGQLSSPRLSKEIAHHQEYEAKVLLKCEKLVAGYYKELEMAKTKINCLEEKKELIFNLAESQDYGEVSEWLKASRKNKMFASITSDLNAERLKLTELQSEIDQIENLSCLTIAKGHYRMEARVDAYFEGLFKEGKNKRLLPDFRQLVSVQLPKEIYQQGHKKASIQDNAV